MKRGGGLNIYLSTTIFAVVGTIVYGLIGYIAYPQLVNSYSMFMFLIIAWAVCFFIMRNK